MNKSEYISKIAQALVKSQASMGNASKDSKNPFYKSSYADLNSVREACIPVLNANEISVLQPTTVIEGKLYVETLLLHSSGEYISGLYEVVVAKQNDPQALGSAISYSRRYGLQSMVNVGAEDNDGESNYSRGQKPIQEAPKKPQEQSKAPEPTNVQNITPSADRGSFRRNKPVPVVTTGTEENL